MSDTSIANKISKLINKAREGFERITKGGTSKEDFNIVAKVLEYVATEHAEKGPETIGFSSATDDHLKKLGVKQGKPITWDDGALDMTARARTKKLSTRFKDTKAAIERAGVSQMEEMHKFIAFNYLLESIDKPGRGTKPSGMDAKFSPEFHIPPITIQSSRSTGSEAPFELNLHGYVDLVTFLTKAKSSRPLISSSDMQHWDKVLSIAMESSCNIEVKRQDTNLKAPHVREAVAQALAALQWAKEKNSQRFVLTDGMTWQFGILEDSVYHLSFDIESEKALGDERILTVLDEWIWQATDHDETALWTIAA